MISPKICSIEEEESSQLSAVSMQPPIFDDAQSSEQQHQSNSTIISKLRSKFSSNNQMEYKSPESIFTQSLQESTVGNQLLLSTEEFDAEKNI
jgi:hypothetical protein